MKHIIIRQDGYNIKEEPSFQIEFNYLTLFEDEIIILIDMTTDEVKDDIDSEDQTSDVAQHIDWTLYYYLNTLNWNAKSNGNTMQLIKWINWINSSQILKIASSGYRGKIALLRYL